MPAMTIDQALEAGMTHHRADRLAEAEGIYRQILAQQPNHAPTLHLLGVLAGQAGKTDAAIALIRRAISIDPREAMFYSNLGRILAQAGQAGEAAEAFRQSLQINPRDATAQFDLGTVLQVTGDLDGAKNCFQQALALQPDYADACNNLGNVHKAQGQIDEAVASYQRAIALSPALVEAHINLGIAWESMDKHEEAIACQQAALARQPQHPGAHFNLGVALAELGRMEEAAAAYQRAVELKPDYADAHNNLGSAYRAGGFMDQAIAEYREAIRLQPDLARAHSNLGAVLDMAGLRDEAIAAYRRALELQPDQAAIHSNLVYALHFHPDYDAQALLREHQEWNRRHALPFRPFIQSHENDRDPSRRLRVGYVSPDFSSHVVGRFIAPLLAAHDKQAVEVFCYSDVRRLDETTQRLKSCADRWRDTTRMGDQELAELIRQDRIDVLVDLTMQMSGNRMLVFARKPSPVQVTYLAYCSTTGLQTMDYRITDHHLDPPDSDLGVYTEQSVFIESYWCYEARPEAPAVNALPAEKNGRITFGCLNNFAKISPETVRTWGELLRLVKNSRLLLHAKSGSHRERIKAEFADLGIDASRVEFAPGLPLADYFQLYHQVDIALDPFPYAGGTTTCDALWMGAPVVTLAGKTAVGRGGVSILSAIGLPECIARTSDAYIDLAADLAGDQARLAQLRATLREKMRSSPLMDAPRFAHNTERAYRSMWKQWCGQPQDANP